MNVDGPVDHVYVVPSYAVDDVVAGEYLLGMFEEEKENLEFGLGELDALAVYLEGVFFGEELDALVGDLFFR